MKIALVSYDFGEYCIRLASALAEEAEVLLVLASHLGRPYRSLLDPRVDYRPFHKPRLRQPLKQLFTLRWITQQVEAFGPDVVHFQDRHLWFNLLGLPTLRRYPLVITVHDLMNHIGDEGGRKTPQAIRDYGYRQADNLIVHGEHLLASTIERFRANKDDVFVIPHIALGDPTARPEVTEEASTVLFFGRIWEYKGLDYLIKAEPYITEQIPEARFVIAGKGEEFERYRRMMVHPDRFIVYNEFIDDNRMAELFRKASVVVLPYIEASQSGVIPVAYTYSKPVVATQVGSLPDAVEEGKTGLLVPPRDEKALAEAVVLLLKRPDLRKTMGLNGKRKIDEEWSPSAVARQTLAVYRSALSRRKLKA